MAFDTTGVYASLNPATMLWPRLITPEAFKKDGKPVGDPKYGGAFVFTPDHPDLSPLKGRAAAVAKGKWPGVEFGTIEWPIKSGDKMIAENKAKHEADPTKFRLMSEDVVKFIAGKVVLQARTKKQPSLGKMTAAGIVVLEGVTLDREKGIFYSGTDALFEINFWPNVGSKGEKYITAYLNAVVSYNKGARIGGSGGPPLTERFKGYAGHATAEDPTAGTLDEEIPF